MKQEDIKIIQWNCRSLYQKLTRFKDFLYREEPHVCCLSETRLKKEAEPIFINYNAYYEHRLEKDGGGLAILVRKDVNFRVKLLDKYVAGNLEIQAITMEGTPNPIDIINLYNPCKNVLKTEFEHYFNQVQNQVIIIGDFNAHHTMWGNIEQNNQSGNNLFDSLFSFPDLNLLTPKGLPTYYNVNNGKTSTIDLCFVSSNLFQHGDIQILDHNLDSDHEIIQIGVVFTIDLQKIECRPKWKFRGGNKWDDWRQQLPELKSNQEFASKYAETMENLISTSRRIFGMTKGIYNPKYSKPWWNQECSEKTEAKKKARKQLKLNPTPSNLIKLKKSRSTNKKGSQKR